MLLLAENLSKELGHKLSPSNRDINNMGIEVVGSALCLLIRIKRLKDYEFLEKVVVDSLYESFISINSLETIFLQLSIRKLQDWFDDIESAQTSNNSKYKLSELYLIIQNPLLNLDMEYITDEEEDLISSIKSNTVHAQLIHFCCLLHNFNLDVIENKLESQDVTDHINACHVCYEQLALLTIPITGHSYVSSSHYCPFISPESLKAVKEECNLSASKALDLLFEARSALLRPLIECLFIENRVTDFVWLTGDCCHTIVGCVAQWMHSIRDAIPVPYRTLLVTCAGSFLTLEYLQHLIRCYRNNKRMRLTSDGAQRVFDDLAYISSWLKSQLIEAHQDSHATEYPGNNEIQQLLKSMQLFLTAMESDVLLCYAETIQLFGVGFGLHLYDLLRLAMKIRIDLNNLQRKHILSLCAHYLSDLMLIINSSANGPLSVLCRNSHLSQRLLGSLCPSAGVEHCTGKKWSLEQSTLKPTEKKAVADVVEQTCRAALLRNEVLRESQLQSETLHATRKLKQQQAKIRVQFDAFSLNFGLKSLRMNSTSRRSLNYQAMINESEINTDVTKLPNNNSRPNRSGFAAIHYALRPRAAKGHSCYMGEENESVPCDSDVLAASSDVGMREAMSPFGLSLANERDEREKVFSLVFDNNVNVAEPIHGLEELYNISRASSMDSHSSCASTPNADTVPSQFHYFGDDADEEDASLFS